jgi:hypothetical protein
MQKDYTSIKILNVNPTNIAPTMKAAICINILNRNLVVFKEKYNLKIKYIKTKFIGVSINAGINLLLKSIYINSLNKISFAIPKKVNKT